VSFIPVYFEEGERLVAFIRVTDFPDEGETGQFCATLSSPLLVDGELPNLEAAEVILCLRAMIQDLENQLSLNIELDQLLGNGDQEQ
jgi:hypothetical protein